MIIVTVNMFSNEIYGAWKEKQIQKYEEVLPVMGDIFEETDRSLDVGVGKAWLWKYLREKGYSFEEIRGVDIDKEATEPEKEYIDYIYTEEFETDDEFDLLVCFDSIHLIDYEEKLMNFLRKGGYMLQSVPVRYEESLTDHPKKEVISEGEIGEREKDRYMLIRKA